jgi:hypothetical protein
MNISDLFIIYLACGAPCGVYFYLQNRKKLRPANLWLKSFLTMFVWIPYAFVLLHDFATKRKQARLLKEKSAFEEKLSNLQRRLLQFHFDSSAEHSLFEFREVLDRYAGLTFAAGSLNETPNAAESEIFRIALRENSRLAAECLHRRNSQRLQFHQNLARRDFLKVLSELKYSAAEPELLKAKALEFAKILSDAEAVEKIYEIFADSLQSANENAVKNLETEVWNPEITKQQPAKQIPIRLKAFIAATSKKD